MNQQGKWVGGTGAYKKSKGLTILIESNKQVKTTTMEQDSLSNLKTLLAQIDKLIIIKAKILQFSDKHVKINKVKRWLLESCKLYVKAGFIFSKSRLLAFIRELA